MKVKPNTGLTDTQTDSWKWTCHLLICFGSAPACLPVSLSVCFCLHHSLCSLSFYLSDRQTDGCPVSHTLSVFNYLFVSHFPVIVIISSGLHLLSLRSFLHPVLFLCHTGRKHFQTQTYNFSLFKQSIWLLFVLKWWTEVIVYASTSQINLLSSCYSIFSEQITLVSYNFDLIFTVFSS